MRRHQARRSHLEPGPMIDVTPGSDAPEALPTPEKKANALLDHPGFAVEEWYDD
jgi:putative transposase